MIRHSHNGIAMTDVDGVLVRSSLFSRGGAVFSKCQRYRYRLDRIWDDALPPLAFGMLNPSTADHERNDATIERCERRARALGFGSLVVWNLFAFRATHPKSLKDQTDPVGPLNDFFTKEILGELRSRSGTAVVGWGIHGLYLERYFQVLKIARTINISFYCLGVTNSGQPKHPLYVSYRQQLTLWPYLDPAIRAISPTEPVRSHSY